MDQIEAFRARVEAALVEFDMAPSRFGHETMADKTFVFDLREGKREPKLSTIQHVDAWIETERAERAKPKRKRA